MSRTRRLMTYPSSDLHDFQQEVISFGSQNKVNIITCTCTNEMIAGGDGNGDEAQRSSDMDAE